MPNIGMGELFVILVIVLLFVGAKRLPELGRSLGEAVREFKKGTQGDEKKDQPPAKKDDPGHS